MAGAATAFLGAGFFSELESLSEELSFFTGAFFTGSAFLPLMTSTSDSDDESLTTFFAGAGAFLAGAATAFFGAGFSSELESLSEELSFFLGAGFLAETATFADVLA